MVRICLVRICLVRICLVRICRVRWPGPPVCRHAGGREASQFRLNHSKSQSWKPRPSSPAVWETRSPGSCWARIKKSNKSRAIGPKGDRQPWLHLNQLDRAPGSSFLRSGNKRNIMAGGGIRHAWEARRLKTPPPPRHTLHFTCTVGPRRSRPGLADPLLLGRDCRFPCATVHHQVANRIMTHLQSVLRISSCRAIITMHTCQ